MIDAWWFNLIAYLALNIVFTQSYKVATKSCKHDGALIVLMQFLSGVIVLVLIPFFGMSFPQDGRTYLLLALSCVLYAIADRSNTTAMKGLEVSEYSIFGQLSTVFIVTWGIIFFKEAIVVKKIIGLILILVGNVFVLYKKGKFRWNKYILFSLLGSLAMSIGISVDVGVSSQFNLPVYVALTLIVPSLLILMGERIKPRDVVGEFKNGNKKAILCIGCSWGAMIIFMMRAYQLGEVTTVAPLCALTTILNVFMAYFVQKEKDSLLRKVIATIIVVLGVVLIKM